MIGEQIEYQNEIYTVLYDYGNGQLEIKKEKSNYTDIKLVSAKDIKVQSNNP